MIADGRLAAEVAAIRALARRLVGLLQRRDPLSETVHLGKLDAFATVSAAGARTWLRRLLRRAGARTRYRRIF
jgi:hypothetical protein